MAVANARPDLSHGYKYNAPQDHYQGATPDHSASGINLNVNEHDHHHVAASGPAPSYSASGSGASVGFGSSGSVGSASFGASGSANQGFSGSIKSGASHGFGASGSAGTSQQSFSASGPAGVISAGNGGSSSSSGNFQSQHDYSSSSGSTVGVAAFPAQQQQQIVVAGFNGGNNAQQYSSASSIKSSGNTFGVSQGSNFNAQQSSNYQQGVNSAASAYSDVQQLEPIITKNFYFEAAPEEPEETQGPRFVPIGRPQKNYKIIFIKTPSYGLNSQVIPIVPPNEEKTIVYVLSKKPEFNQDIELPSIPVTEATKPEVFFIKYKNDQEASDAQNQIQGENIFRNYLSLPNLI